jgi:hypothetical protein
MTNVTPNKQLDNGVWEIGGELKIASGGKISAAGTQATVIAANATNLTLSAEYTKLEIETSVNALATKFNALLAACKGAGIVASS